MPLINRNLHGMVPDKSPVVLLLLDVINDLDFPGAEYLQKQSATLGRRLSALKRRAREAGIPAIYVNDNYGRWQSDFNATIEHCRRPSSPGRQLVEQLLPDKDDYFVLKPKHSGFFSTTLDILVDYLQADTVIVTGIAGNICVLFTANDAYMRDFKVVVPKDCTASNSREENNQALKIMAKILKADTTTSTRIDFAELTKSVGKRRGHSG